MWFDDTVQRLNTDKRGTFLGSFGPDDKIVTIMKSGNYKLSGFDLATHFDEDMTIIEKFNPNKPVSAVYLDGESKTYFVKRFLIEPSDKKVLFISESEGSHLEIVTTNAIPVLELKFSKVKDKEMPDEMVNLVDFIGVKGFKAKGNKLSYAKIKDIKLLDPVEVQIEEDVLDEFEESGLSPLEALKKSTTPEKTKEKPHISIDHEINAELKLPSEEKKKHKKSEDDNDDGQITMDL
jgi:topoisomerase-4 subunit A